MCLSALPALQSLPSHGDLPAACFVHVHIDLVGPLPTSAGYTYYLTAVDHFTHWPEVIPIPDITADTMACALLTFWISRFGCSLTITTDQGRRFELQLFQSLAKMCGIQLSWTTAHHPVGNNGLVERFHRTLKAAIICHADQQWTEALPLVLLGIRTSFKEDLQACVWRTLKDPRRAANSRVPTQWIQRFSSLSSADTWPTSYQFRQLATPPRLHSCTKTSRSVPTSSSVRTQHARPWSPHTATPTKPCHGEI
jgi:transposase InsO family protein